MGTGPTVEEQLIRDVISTIEAISPGTGFNKEFVKVARQDRNALKHPAVPLAIVAHESTDKDDSRLGMCVATLNLIVAIIIRSKEGPEWPQVLDLYVSDVENALRADSQRGGLAVKTAITRGHVYDSDELGSTYTVGAQLHVEISFRHYYTDTTSEI